MVCLTTWTFTVPLVSVDGHGLLSGQANLTLRSCPLLALARIGHDPLEVGIAPRTQFWPPSSVYPRFVQQAHHQMGSSQAGGLFLPRVPVVAFNETELLARRYRVLRSRGV
jgi:hypothetical protein